MDNAWPAAALSFPTLDATSLGPQLRFSAPSRLIEEFYRQAPKEPFALDLGAATKINLRAFETLWPILAD